MMRDGKLIAVAIRSKQPVERVTWRLGRDPGRAQRRSRRCSAGLKIDAAEVGFTAGGRRLTYAAVLAC